MKRRDCFLTGGWFDALAEAQGQSAAPGMDCASLVNVTIGDPAAPPIVNDHHFYVDPQGRPRIVVGHHPDARLLITVRDYDLWTRDFLTGEIGRFTHSSEVVVLEGAVEVLFHLRSLLHQAAAEPFFRAVADVTMGHPVGLVASVGSQPIEARRLQGGAERTPRTAAALTDLMNAGVFVGAQVYVSMHGLPFVEFAIGRANPQKEMTLETPIPLLCCIKPVTAIAISKLWEENKFDLYTRVSDLIPEFGANNKERITIFDILTHTTPVYKDPLFISPRGSRDEILSKIWSVRVDDYPSPPRGSYAVSWAWIVLGEVIARSTGETVEAYLAREVLEPIGMSGVTLRLDEAAWEARKAALSDLYLCRGANAVYMYDADSELSRQEAGKFFPGSGGLGTARDLGRMLEFLAGWNLVARPPIQRCAATAMTARHRVATAERVGLNVTDFGLGLQLESRFHREDRARFSFGPDCSYRSFGHRSYQCSMMFADPEHGVTAVMLTNGINDTPTDEEKCRRFSAALYQDLAVEGLIVNFKPTMTL